MPTLLDEVKPEDIDPKPIEVKTVVSEGGPPVLGAIMGSTVGLMVSKSINTFADSRPEDQRDFTKFGLKIISTCGGLVEIAGATAMEDGSGKMTALVGGASFVATEMIEMISDAFSLREWIFPKKKGNPQKKKVDPKIAYPGTAEAPVVPPPAIPPQQEAVRDNGQWSRLADVPI